MKSLQQHKESGEYLSDTRSAASSVNQTATSNANEKNSNLQSNSQGVPDNKRLYSKVVVDGSVGSQETHESFDGTHSQATLNTVSESNRVDLSTGAEGTDSSDGEDKQTLVQQGPTIVPKESEGLAIQTPPAKDAELSENQAPAQQELPTVLKGSEETVTENASGLSARDDITENDSVNDTKVSNGHSIHLEQDASLVNQASTSNGSLPSSNQSISKGVDLNNGAENTDSGGGGNKQSSITSELSTSITVSNNNGFSEQEDNGMITSKVSSNSEENSPESMHRSVTDNSEQIVSSLENSENELSDYQGKSEKLSNTEADVEPLVRGNGHIEVVSTAISNQPNSVSNDDETKRDSVQSAAHVEQIDDRQVPLIQNHSRLENNQQDLQSEVSPTVDNGNPNNIAFTNENVEMPTPEQKSDTKIDVKQSADSNNGSVTTPSVQPALPESVDKNSGKEDTQLKSTVVHLVANEGSEQVNNTQGNNKQHSYSGKNNTEGSDRNEALRQDHLVSPERNQGQFSSGIAQDNASTPTYENVSGSNSANNSSINEADLSDRFGVAGVSRMAEPMNRVAVELKGLEELIEELREEQSLCGRLQKIHAGIKEAAHALVGEAGRLVLSSRKIHCEELESCDQLTLMSKRGSEIQNGADTHLDVEHQELHEQASRLKEDNGRLSNEKDRISKKNDQLEGNLSISEQILSETSQTLKNTEGQLKKTKKELDDAKEDASQLKREVSDGQTEINGLIGRIRKLTQEKDQLKGELDRTGTEFKEKEKALNAANGRVSKLEQDLKRKNQEIGDLGDQAAQSARQNGQLERRLNDAEQCLEKQAEKLKNTQAQLTERIDEINEVRDQFNGLVEDLEGLISKFTLIANEKEVLSGEVTHLTEENTQLKGNLKTTTKKNAQLQDKLESTQKTLCEKDSKITQLTKGNTQLKNQIQDLRKQLESKNGLEGKLSSIKQDLAAKTKELENTDQKVLRLEQEKLSQKASIDNLTGKVTTLTEENTQLQNGLKSTQESLGKKDSQIGNLNSQLKDKCGQFKELNDKLESKSKELNDIQEQLENKSELENQVKELSGKNKKFSEANTHGKGQGNYASVSFVLSSAFAVGASLTMFHLAICISLAVVSLTFLAVGCYCSYKANTALSNVEVDNCVNPAVVEV